jgi:hypothetical protein
MSDLKGLKSPAPGGKDDVDDGFERHSAEASEMFTLGACEISLAGSGRVRAPVIEVAPAPLLVVVIGPQGLFAVAAWIDTG